MVHLQVAFLILSIVFVTAFMPEILKYKEGQDYFVMTDKRGNLILVDLRTDEIQPTAYDPAKDVILRLYTRNNFNDSNIIVNGSEPSLTNSFIDKKKPVKILIHGWTDDGSSPNLNLLKNAFLEALDVNVITVDWGAGADSPLYPIACQNVPPTGRFLGSFIDWLVTQGFSVSQFHVIGHSLGSHVAGFTGRSVTKGKVPYLTALDPALPLWDANSARVNKNDADYVEVIHTNAGVAGIVVPVGHNDFYPNGGQTQPGCLLIDSACSHNRAYDLLAYSLDNNNFMAEQCTNHTQALAGECFNIGNLHLGGSLPKPELGVFFLTTTATPPFYK